MTLNYVAQPSAFPGLWLCISVITALALSKTYHAVDANFDELFDK